MGTSGSYSGSGGKVGRDLRQGLEDWLDALPTDGAQDNQPGEAEQNQVPVLPPTVLPATIALLRSSHGSGSGDGVGGAVRGGAATSGGSTSGGAQRSVRRSATTAGRAAAAAYALRTGNRAELARLGLDYDALRLIDDPLELTRVIVEAACGQRSDSTIEDHEQRYVAAEIAAWVLEQNEGGAPPNPEEIVRKTIAMIVVEVIETEMGDLLRSRDRPTGIAELVEGEVQGAAEVLAERAELSVDGATAEEFSNAIEDGIETLRRIFGEG